jgi:ketosteroid isomerase-like protein
MIKKTVLLLLFTLLLGACNSANAQDGVEMPPGVPTIYGRDGLVADLRSAFEVITISDMQINIEEVQVAGDWAYARGNYSYMLGSVPEDGSDPIFIDGKYMSIFQKQSDGSWKLHRDIFNSNTAE